MSVEPLLGQVAPPPADDSGIAFGSARHVTPYKFPVLTGVPFTPISAAGPGCFVAQRGQIVDHMTGDAPTMQEVTNSNPILRDIYTYPRQYPDGVTAQTDPYPTNRRTSAQTSARFSPVITPSWQDWGAIPAPFMEEEDDQTPSGNQNAPLDPLTWPDDSIYPGVPIELSDNEVLNPPCEGGGTGSPRPDYGVLYPRKI